MRRRCSSSTCTGVRQHVSAGLGGPEIKGVDNIVLVGTLSLWALAPGIGQNRRLGHFRRRRRLRSGCGDVGGAELNPSGFAFKDLKSKVGSCRHRVSSLQKGSVILALLVLVLTESVSIEDAGTWFGEETMAKQREMVSEDERAMLPMWLQCVVALIGTTLIAGPAAAVVWYR